MSAAEAAETLRAQKAISAEEAAPYVWVGRSLRLSLKEKIAMPFSTMTSKGQTTVPKEALDLEPGAKLRWEVRGGSVAVTTERPLLWELEGFIKHGEPDAVKAVAAARKMRGRI